MERKDILLLIIQENKFRLWAADLKHECTRGSRTLKDFRMRIKKLNVSYHSVSIWFRHHRTAV
jgi:hypothetical protein